VALAAGLWPIVPGTEHAQRAAAERREIASEGERASAYPACVMSRPWPVGTRRPRACASSCRPASSLTRSGRRWSEAVGVWRTPRSISRPHQKAEALEIQLLARSKRAGDSVCRGKKGREVTRSSGDTKKVVENHPRCFVDAALAPRIAGASPPRAPLPPAIQRRHDRVPARRGRFVYSSRGNRPEVEHPVTRW